MGLASHFHILEDRKSLEIEHAFVRPSSRGFVGLHSHMSLYPALDIRCSMQHAHIISDIAIWTCLSARIGDQDVWKAQCQLICEQEALSRT